VTAIAVIGPEVVLATCAPLGPEFARTDRAGLAAAGADVVVAFSPGERERGLIAELSRPAILWYGGQAEAPAETARQRVVAACGPAWRNVAFPVTDSAFSACGPDTLGSVAWLGPASPRRHEYLRWFPDGPAVSEKSDSAVAVNLVDPTDERSHGHRVAYALAEGRLVVSERLTPARGLEPGSDYLAGADLSDVFHAVVGSHRSPASFRRVRLRGRMKAELFRSSAVVRRLAGDLLRELALPRA
jgi:hypothetical protein